MTATATVTRATQATSANPAPSVHELLQTTRRRIGLRAAMRGATIAVLAAAALVLLRVLFTGVSQPTWTLGPVVLFVTMSALFGAAIGAVRARVSPTGAARRLESLVPSSRNLLVTAEELLRAGAPPAASPGAASPGAVAQHPVAHDGVSQLVLRRADAFARTVHAQALLPLGRRALELSGSMLSLTVMLLVMHRVAPVIAAGVNTVRSSLGNTVAITQIGVRIEPPAYTGNTPVSDTDPTRIAALSGSRIRLSISAVADSLVVTTRDSSRTIGRSTGNAFTVEIPAQADGFVALTPRSSDGRAGTRRLIGITVRADDAPRVRIVAPAQDLIVPDARRSLAITVEADDDLALGTLRLRYTKVSGSGERFTFSEGEVPLAVARAKPESWSARATLALEPLLQEPGDLVVYRAVATDKRPGSPPIESDAFIAELAAPGGVAALGFSLDPDEDRYALSQQMVILKTERLLAQRATLAPDSLKDRAMQLAGEQRRVRAEFVFMMGGEFAQEVTGEDGSMELDETAEAEGESDLAAGRMVNRGRTALLSAVRAMSRAAVALNTANLTPALAQEKLALTQLQEAFARNRFLMRALSQREQLDLTRRLTGRLDSIARGSARVPTGQSNARTEELRGLLSELTSAVAARATADNATSGFVDLAERLLQTDASSPATQRIARQLTEASAAPSTRTVQALLDSAVTGLTSVLERDLRPASAAASSADARRLRARLEESLSRVPGANRRTPGGG